MRRIIICNPKKTVTLSVTGTDCDLKCAHCGRHFLFGMRTIKEALDTKAESYLISGGCTKDGNVPIDEKTLKKLKNKGARLNIHSGLVTEQQAMLLGRYADTISFDFVYDDNTIDEVYGMKKTKDDYLRSYRFLKKHAKKVVPHICIGLNGGKLSGEKEAIDALFTEGTTEVTFLVFMPIQGTIFENCNPPKEEDVFFVFRYARERLKNARINLGCMRPRRLYDIAAVKAGLDCIVIPSRKAIELCEELKIHIEKKDDCCSL
ncbi:radical SAM protein [Candidatus Woesearchaeota archaeon CG11_big_fil_rev_8_21_14_0_20_43_8]|nr:MAG: radical SAM protein [Candidatus Woesearchaeota archaeon CG11_big_fil_rev_8_21_14_0_20_43_8]